MDEQLLESLLYQEESETLDFKREQYPFAKATETQKAELLKDIVAFANAWRQTDAYILIGVEEVRGGKSIVHGVDPELHLLDRNLQHFVSNKTNRPVSFSYRPFRFKGVDIGIITIPVQARPIYLISSYGHLKQNVVYLRRGSSTAEAAPDEIAMMAAHTATPAGQPTLEVEFCNLKTRETYGNTIVARPRLLELPQADAIPPYGKEPTWIYGYNMASETENRQYYREIADYLLVEASAFPIGVAVNNFSTTMAENVVVTMLAPKNDAYFLLDDFDLPQFPTTSTLIPKIPLGNRSPRRVVVQTYGDNVEIRAVLGVVQPGMTNWAAAPFFIAAKSRCVIEVRATLSANNLRIPATATMHIEIEPVKESVSLEEVMRRARKRM